jgi:hypothetical protein
MNNMGFLCIRFQGDARRERCSVHSLPVPVIHGLADMFRQTKKVSHPAMPTYQHPSDNRSVTSSSGNRTPDGRGTVSTRLKLTRTLELHLQILHRGKQQAIGASHLAAMQRLAEAVPVDMERYATPRGTWSATARASGREEESMEKKQHRKTGARV